MALFQASRSSTLNRAGLANLHQSAGGIHTPALAATPRHARRLEILTPSEGKPKFFVKCVYFPSFDVREINFRNHDRALSSQALNFVIVTQDHQLGMFVNVILSHRKCL